MEEKIIGECSCCGFDIYEGESYYMVNGLMYHAAEYCMAGMARDHFAPFLVRTSDE